MKRSAKEEVRAWRAFMLEEWGPDWAARMAEAFDEKHKGWTTMEMKVFGKNGEVLSDFVMFARGGFEGERLPEGPPEGW